MSSQPRKGIARKPSSPERRQLQKRAVQGRVTVALPLIHITATGFVQTIMQSKQLETRFCPVFQRQLLYFFAGRPAYRLKDGDAKSHQINRFPAVFVVSPKAVPVPYHVYPFDTGGAVHGRFNEQADPFIALEDYELEPKQSAVSGHIAWAFSTTAAYFDGELRADIEQEVPYHETVTRGYIDIARLAGSGSNQPDKRASAIEVASYHHVVLHDHAQLVILPRQYLEDPAGPNTPLFQQLNALSIPWRTYEWQPNTVPNEFQKEIDRITRIWFQEQGIL